MARPVSDIKAQIRDKVYRDWTEQWTKSTAARHTKIFYDRPDHNKARYVLKLARLELGRFVRLVTNHNNLRYFQHLIGLAESPTCRLCLNSPESFSHFLFSCPRLRSLRIDIFQDELPTSDRNWSVRKLLAFTYNTTVNEAFEGDWEDGDGHEQCPPTHPEDSQSEDL